MKMRRPYTILTVFFFLFVSSCIPEVQDTIGTAVFQVSIVGYTEEGEKTIALDLNAQNTGKSISRSVPLDSENSASAYFTSLGPGTWDATIQLLNDDSQVGSHTFSFDVFADETTENRIEGTYSNGELNFIVYTSDSTVEPQISLNDYRGTLFEERRYWDDSKSSPEQFVRINAEGDLEDLNSCTVIFPDSYRFFIGPNTNRHVSFTFDQWYNSSTGQNGFYLDRYAYFSTGSYFCSVYDENNLGDSFTYTFNIDGEGVSAPVITNPLEGQSYDNTTNEIFIEWSFDDSYEIATTLVFVVQEDSSTALDFSQVVEGSNSTTIPIGTLALTINYNLIVIGIEQPISAPNPGNPINELQGFTSSGQYEYNEVIEALYLSEDPKLEYIGSAQLNFSTF